MKMLESPQWDAGDGDVLGMEMLESPLCDGDGDIIGMEMLENPSCDGDGDVIGMEMLESPQRDGGWGCYWWTAQVAMHESGLIHIQVCLPEIHLAGFIRMPPSLLPYPAFIVSAVVSMTVTPWGDSWGPPGKVINSGGSLGLLQEQSVVNTRVKS